MGYWFNHWQCSCFGGDNYSFQELGTDIPVNQWNKVWLRVRLLLLNKPFFVVYVAHVLVNTIDYALILYPVMNISQNLSKKTKQNNNKKRNISLLQRVDFVYISYVLPEIIYRMGTCLSVCYSHIHVCTHTYPWVNRMLSYVLLYLCGVSIKIILISRFADFRPSWVDSSSLTDSSYHFAAFFYLFFSVNKKACLFTLFSSQEKRIWNFPRVFMVFVLFCFFFTWSVTWEWKVKQIMTCHESSKWSVTE